MAAQYGKFDLKLDALPGQIERLRVRIDRQVVNGKNRVLFLYPNSGKGAEPLFRRYGVGMSIQLGGHTSVSGLGQLVVTGERILGIFTDGTAGTLNAGKITKTPLDEKSGAIFAFALERDELNSVNPKPNWRGKPVEVVLASTEEADPWFVLHVIAVAASIKSDGSASPSSVSALLGQLTAEGRMSLQRASAE